MESQQAGGRVTLVTGASSGLGRALAIELGTRGHSLALIARREAEVSETARAVDPTGRRSFARVADISDRHQFVAAIDETVARFGRLDVLINNAGRGHNAAIEETPPEQIESMFRVNVFPLWYGVAAALPHMRRAGRGLIVNIASIAGKLGYPGNAAYVAAKHAVIGFTRALRAEMVESGIEAMAVIPAGITTEWANSAEGGSLTELFAYERERGLAITRERGVDPPRQFALMSPEAVARIIADALDAPVPELYTHPGTHAAVVETERDPIAHELEQAPMWLAHMQGRSRGT